jgi:microsomal dipeptidase-like Zn-dependent dipeptidase
VYSSFLRFPWTSSVVVEYLLPKNLMRSNITIAKTKGAIMYIIIANLLVDHPSFSSKIDDILRHTKKVTAKSLKIWKLVGLDYRFIPVANQGNLGRNVAGNLVCR